MFTKNGRNILPPKDRAARIKAIRREVYHPALPKIESCGMIGVNVPEERKEPKKRHF